MYKPFLRSMNTLTDLPQLFYPSQTSDVHTKKLVRNDTVGKIWTDTKLPSSTELNAMLMTKNSRSTSEWTRK